MLRQMWALKALLLALSAFDDVGGWSIFDLATRGGLEQKCNASKGGCSRTRNVTPEEDLGDPSDGVRGASPRTDSRWKDMWVQWFVRFSWDSLWQIAESGLVWCGTLCASVGIAARWSYWLLVAVVGMFLLQLLLWSITWVLIPFSRHAVALYRYLRGYGGWHEVMTLHGVGTFRPKWYGPKGSLDAGLQAGGTTRHEPPGPGRDEKAVAPGHVVRRQRRLQIL